MSPARKSTEEPAPKTRKETMQAVERRWYEAGIKALDAETQKHQIEKNLYRTQLEIGQEELANLRYLRMERETMDRSRRVYDFFSEVSEETVSECIAWLSDWAAETQEPILIRLKSPGGDVVEGLALVDYVQGLRNKGLTINTLALGWCASMASILLQMGEKRYMSENSFMLIHEDRTFYEEPFMEKITDTEDRVKFGWMLEERCDKILAERSIYTPKKLRETYARRDWWLDAKECLSKGFADTIWTGRTP